MNVILCYENENIEEFNLQLNEILKKTRIKKGFLETTNSNWNRIGKISPEIFDVTSENILERIFKNDTKKIEVFKEGHQVIFSNELKDNTKEVSYLHSSRKFNEYL